jgi:anthranilate phosphoribosyltransferase
VATTFNFLGPLTNPARPAAQAVGVADARMAPVLAGVLARRGVEALVFRGDDGLDELTISSTSTVWVSRAGSEDVQQVQVDPRDLGVPRAPVETLRGGDPAHNAEVFGQVLAGEPGPVRDAVVLNAAAAIAAHTAADGAVGLRLADGLRAARDAIDSGAAATVLERWVAATQR